MSYTPTKTWLDGDVLLASDVQGELDDVRAYVSQVSASAVAETDWIQPRHVVRGEYDAITNTARMVSGVYSGISVPEKSEYTYMTTYNTIRGGVNVWEYVPLTSMTLEIRRPCSIMINWWMSARSPDNQSGGTSGETDIRLYLGNKSIRPAAEICRVTEEDDTNVFTRLYRQIPGGFYMANFTVGTYTLGLVTQSTTSKCYGFAWGISAEVFCM